MNFTSIKKKTRGLRRKLKRIDKWKAENIRLDVDALKRHERIYVKLWIPPFYNLYSINQNQIGHKNPPNWFNKLILSAMLDVYQSWKETLDELGEPYYLKIWLYDPHFINSQIVAAIGDGIDYYKEIFEKDESNIKFPIEKYRLNHQDILAFKWECHKDQYVVFQSDYQDDQSYLDYLQKKSYKIQEEQILDKREVVYYIREGNVWIGTLS